MQWIQNRLSLFTKRQLAQLFKRSSGGFWFSEKKKNEKGKKGRERHTTGERKKWERDKEEGRQRERDKEKETGEEKRERKRKIKFHCSHLVQEDASRKKIPLAERGSGAGTKIVATPNINHFVEIWFWAILATLKRGSHPLFLKQSALSQNPLIGGFWNLGFLRRRVAKKFYHRKFFILMHRPGPCEVKHINPSI